MRLAGSQCPHMCFQRWLKQTKHEKSFKSPVATLLPPFSRLLPPSPPCPCTTAAPIIFTTRFFFLLSLPPSLLSLGLRAANHFFQDNAHTIVPPPG